MFVETDHEIIAIIFLPLLLIQEVQLLVTLQDTSNDTHNLSLCGEVRKNFYLDNPFI